MKQIANAMAFSVMCFCMTTYVHAGSVTTQCGGNGGNDFANQSPDKIGLRYGSGVDALVLNGIQHGGNGGSATSQFELDPGDYWTHVVIRSGTNVDYLELGSKNGRVVKGGGGGGNVCLNLNDVKVIKIGGRSGEMLDNIRVEYIEHYNPRAEIAKGSWQLVCSGICNQEMTTGLVSSNGGSESNSDEKTKSSFKASMRISVFEGGGTGTTQGSAMSETTRHTMESNFDTTTSESIKKQVVFTHADMAALHVSSVWQWVMRNDSSIWKSSFMACTPNDIPPNWIPGVGHSDGCNGAIK